VPPEEDQATITENLKFGGVVPDICVWKDVETDTLMTVLCSRAGGEVLTSLHTLPVSPHLPLLGHTGSYKIQDVERMM